MDCLVEIRTALADGLESLEPEDRVLRKIGDWEALPRGGTLRAGDPRPPKDRRLGGPAAGR